MMACRHGPDLVVVLANGLGNLTEYKLTNLTQGVQWCNIKSGWVRAVVDAHMLHRARMCVVLPPIS